MRRAPERIDTARLVLRRPVAGDAEAIFARYAADADVTRYLSFPRHVSVEETRAFLALSDVEWENRSSP
jgi:RimJ/RimL family protein N-acetyltransferase